MTASKRAADAVRLAHGVRRAYECRDPLLQLCRDGSVLVGEGGPGSVALLGTRRRTIVALAIYCRAAITSPREIARW
jgi:hypothetical protein